MAANCFWIAYPISLFIHEVGEFGFMESVRSRKTEVQ